MKKYKYELYDDKMDDIQTKCMRLIKLAERDLLSDANMRDFIDMLAKYRQLMINEYVLKGKD